MNSSYVSRTLYPAWRIRTVSNMPVYRSWRWTVSSSNTWGTFSPFDFIHLWDEGKNIRHCAYWSVRWAGGPQFQYEYRFQAKNMSLSTLFWSANFLRHVGHFCDRETVGKQWTRVFNVSRITRGNKLRSPIRRVKRLHYDEAYHYLPSQIILIFFIYIPQYTKVVVLQQLWLYCHNVFYWSVTIKCHSSISKIFTFCKFRYRQKKTKVFMWYLTAYLIKNGLAWFKVSISADNECWNCAATVCGCFRLPAGAAVRPANVFTLWRFFRPFFARSRGLNDLFFLLEQIRFV